MNGTLARERLPGSLLKKLGLMVLAYPILCRPASRSLTHQQKATQNPPSKQIVLDDMDTRLYRMLPVLLTSILSPVPITMSDT